MRIDSARSIKDEVLASPVCGVARSGIAIGISRGTRDDDYKLAIRIVKPVQSDERVVRQIVAQAKGEVDIRQVCTRTIAVAGGPPQAWPISRVLKIGVSVAHCLGSAGTLGFFARRVCDGALGFVSCNHVIAAEDRGRDGDEILHPGPRDGGRKPDDVVGYLDGKYVVLGDDSAEAEADCAFARLEAATECDPSSISPNETLNNNNLATACDVESVQKIGRTTGRTTGRISAFEIDIPIRYSFGEVTLRSQIEIESLNGMPFSRRGDSGALAFSLDRCPVGLVSADCSWGGRDNSGLTYATPIERVLRLLRVELSC